MATVKPLPPSLYADTAVAAPTTQPLSGDTNARVVIVGAGFTGLSAALHLAEAGIETVVVEANAIGWGASGRNGGQVNSGLKWEPEAMRERFGADLGSRMTKLGGTAPDLVFSLIDTHGLDCAAHRGGTIRAAVPKRSFAGIRDFVRQWQAEGADVTLATTDDMRALTGTSAYPLGAFDKRGGQLNPLSYARELARVALAAGARIVTGTQAEALSREGASWILKTSGGTIRADHVVLATNGYTDRLWPGLKESVIPVYSAITATAPLPESLRARIMPTRPVLYEMSASYVYYRIDDAGRFLMGGRSVLRDTADPIDYRGLVAHALRLFPDLAGIEWTHAWNGQVAVTWDHLPHIHEPAPGLSIGLGYNGRGVAMATAMGRMLARRIETGSPEALDLPVTGVKPIVGHALWPVAVASRLRLDRFRDWIDM